MKNRYLSLLLIIGVLGINFLTSCSDTKSNINYIPEDALAVILINGEKVFNYTDIVDYKNLNDYKEFNQDYGDKFYESLKLLDVFADDIDKSGLLLSKTTLAFMKNVNDKPASGLIIPIDKEVFENNLKVIGEDLGFPIKLFFKNKDDLTYFTPDNKTVIAYNNNILLLFFNESNNNSFELAKAVIDNKSSNKSIMNNKDFKEFYYNAKDMNLWISSSIIDLNDEATENIAHYENLLGFDLKNNYGHFHFEINETEITMTQKFRLGEENENIDLRKLFNNIDLIVNDASQLIANLFGNNYPEFSEKDFEEAQWMNMSDEDIDKEIEKLLKEHGAL